MAAHKAMLVFVEEKHRMHLAKLHSVKPQEAGETKGHPEETAQNRHQHRAHRFQGQRWEGGQLQGRGWWRMDEKVEEKDVGMQHGTCV